MKKVFVLLLVATLVLCFAGCSNNNETIKADGLNHVGTIPAGGTYIVGVQLEFAEDENGNIIPKEKQESCDYYYADDEFPEIKGGQHYYIYGDYIYEHGFYLLDDNSSETTSSWNVTVLNKTKESYDDVLASINGAPVLFLNMTFAGCENLKTAPKLPETIINMFGTFSGCYNLENITNIPANVENLECAFDYCENLKTVPTIPASVTNMVGTFAEAYELTVVEINANPELFEDCFAWIPREQIHIAGSCSQETKDNLLNTADGE